MLTSNGAFLLVITCYTIGLENKLSAWGGEGEMLMRISVRALFYGVLLYLAFEAWVEFLFVLETANQNLYLTILGVIPWVMFVAVLMIAVLVVIVPWDWLEEGM